MKFELDLLETIAYNVLEENELWKIKVIFKM